MVKKTSILGKLKNRWKSPDPVRSGGGRGVGPEPTPRITPEPAVAAPPERVPNRKMSAQEDAVVALGEGFRELSSMVRGVQTRMEDQGERSEAVTESVKQLPALGQAQLDLLRQMAAQMEQQNQASGKMMTALGTLPELLDGVRTALDRANGMAATLAGMAACGVDSCTQAGIAAAAYTSV